MALAEHPTQRILIDSAKRRKRDKRGRGAVVMSLDTGIIDVGTAATTPPVATEDGAIDPISPNAAMSTSPSKTRAPPRSSG